MGYWSEHPMGGDSPMDSQFVIMDVLFTGEEFDNEEIYTYDEIKKRLSEQIEKVLEVVKEDLDDEFVLPFTIAEFEVQIKDKTLSEEIKEMIYDGDNCERGYEYDPVPTKENNYTDFDRPICYANQLRDLWDELMENKSKFNELGKNKGLFVIINEQIEKDDLGLINVD